MQWSVGGPSRGHGGYTFYPVYWEYELKLLSRAKSVIFVRVFDEPEKGLTMILPLFLTVSVSMNCPRKVLVTMGLKPSLINTLYFR